MSTLCAYELTELGDTADELICLQPFVNRRAASFRLYAESDVEYALAGEIDAATDELFATTDGCRSSATTPVARTGVQD